MRNYSGTLGQLYFTLSGIIIMVLGITSQVILFRVSDYIVVHGEFLAYIAWFSLVTIFFSLPLIGIGLNSILKAKMQTLTIAEFFIMMFFTSILVFASIQVEISLNNLNIASLQQMHKF